MFANCVRSRVLNAYREIERTNGGTCEPTSHRSTAHTNVEENIANRVDDCAFLKTMSKDAALPQLRILAVKDMKLGM